MTTPVSSATVTATGARAAARTASPYSAEFRSELLKAWRTPEFVFPTLVLPLAFYAFFGLVMSRGADTPSYLMATYGVFAALGPALFGFGASVAFEREQGLLALKRVSPMPPAAYLIAKLLISMVFTAIVLFGLYALGALVGGVALPRSGWVTLALVHVLATVPFALIGLALGFALKGNAAIAICNILFFVLAVCGGLWMPIEFLPKVMQVFAYGLPSYHLAELSLIAAGRPRAHSWELHVPALAGFTALFALLAWLAWRRHER